MQLAFFVGEMCVEGVDSDIVFNLLMNSGMGTAYPIAEGTMDTD